MRIFGLFGRNGRNRRTLYATVRYSHQLVTEKRAVGPHLDHRMRQRRANQADTFSDKRPGAARIVHVAAAMKKVQDLQRLGDRAEERVVAARAFLFASLTEPVGDGREW